MTLSKFSTLSRKEREKLPSSNFGDPDRLLFPIMDQGDVNTAVRLLEKTKEPGKIKARISAIAQHKGFNLPDDWKNAKMSAEERTVFSEMKSELKTNDGNKFTATFSETSDTGEDGFVIRKGIVFEAGEYADKKFSLTPEQMLNASLNFTPCEFNYEHGNGPLDGHLGQLSSIEVGEDGWSLYGEAKIPSWLDAIYKKKGEPLKVSGEWNRKTKSLDAIAIVENPRVKSAEMFAAFTSDELKQQFSEDDEVINFLEKDTVATFLEKWSEEQLAQFADQTAVPGKTHDGQRIMQRMHDMSAEAGAACDPSNPNGHTRSYSYFKSKEELSAIQKIHNLSKTNGAKCNYMTQGTDGSQSMFSKGSKTADTDKTSGQKQSETTRKATNMSGEKKSLKDRILALLSTADEAKDVDETESAVVDDKENKEGNEAKMSKTDKKTETTAVVTGMSDAEKAEFSAVKVQLAEEREARIDDAAKTFAEEMVRTERAYPKDRPNLIAAFKRASKDDAKLGDKVKFSDGTKEVEGTRVDELRALYSDRRPHNLTKEQLETFGLLSSSSKKEEQEITSVVKLAEAHATKLNGNRARNKD